MVLKELLEACGARKITLYLHDLNSIAIDLADDDDIEAKDLISEKILGLKVNWFDCLDVDSIGIDVKNEE